MKINRVPNAAGLLCLKHVHDPVNGLCGLSYAVCLGQDEAMHLFLPVQPLALNALFLQHVAKDDTVGAEDIESAGDAVHLNAAFGQQRYVGVDGRHPPVGWIPVCMPCLCRRRRG
jgi:hypothetical protein